MKSLLLSLVFLAVAGTGCATKGSCHCGKDKTAKSCACSGKDKGACKCKEGAKTAAPKK